MTIHADDQSEGARKSPPATWVPPGHFYSPIVDTKQLEARRSRIFDRNAMPSGVDLNAAGQLSFLRTLAKHLGGLDLRRAADRRFFLDNPAFNCADAYFLAAILREAKPQRVLEIGSGYSSALTMDVVEGSLGGRTALTFVEPFPNLLRSLMRPADLATHRIIESAVQDVDPAIVDSLEENDILFIDSTHVAKTGSDVLFDFFELLPRLKPGVLVHIHDIFYPFEYPEKWLFEENRSWNEAYVLRSLLTGNDRYEIVLWPDYLFLHHPKEARQALPAACPLWGGSIWLRVRSGGRKPSIARRLMRSVLPMFSSLRDRSPTPGRNNAI